MFGEFVSVSPIPTVSTFAFIYLSIYLQIICTGLCSGLRDHVLGPLSPATTSVDRKKGLHIPAIPVSYPNLKTKSVAHLTNSPAHSFSLYYRSAVGNGNNGTEHALR